MATPPFLNASGSINSRQSFCNFLGGNLPNQAQSWQELINTWAKHLMDGEGASRGAVANVKGDWYEWLLAIEAWNLSAANQNAAIIVQLPNVSQFEVTRLYTPQLHAHIADLRAKVLASTQTVTLITSNPDFAIIQLPQRPPQFNTPITEVTPNTLAQLEGAYQAFIDLCQFDAIKGYVSVKFSLRPDRRLQLPHEGSLMKALYRHLQTREWILGAPGIRYFGMSTAINQADVDAMQTVATHSIISVQSNPERAVDVLYQVDNRNDAAIAFQDIQEHLAT